MSIPTVVYFEDLNSPFICIFLGFLRLFEDDRAGMPCSKGPRVRFQPWAAVVSAQPLQMGHMRYKLSPQGA